MLGELELKNDDWVKAKETLRAASDATDGKDSYATLSLVCLLLSSHFTVLFGMPKACKRVRAAILRISTGRMCGHVSILPIVHPTSSFIVIMSS